MTRSEIIELANQLTERKGEKVLNLQSLYRFVIQDIAKRQRFWWRYAQVNFNIVGGTTNYDLTSITTTPSLSEIAIEEITKISIITATNPLATVELVPIFDPEARLEMTANTSAAQPSIYTMNPLDWKTIQINLPDQNYSAYLCGWAMPNPASDSTNDSVPLIPPWGHNTIVSGMNAKIFKFAYGSKNEKTIDAMAEYEQGMQDLMSKKQFDPNYSLQLTMSDTAVRST